MRAATWTSSIALALLIGCAGPQIHYGQLSALDKGMSPDTVHRRLQQQPLSTHAASAGDRTFDFHRFRMNNGVQTDLYLLAFEKERLVYWGYVSDFRRLKDAEMNQALTSVLPQVLAAK